MSKLKQYQIARLNSYNFVRDFETTADGKIVIHLMAAYSWSNEAFVHTKSFNSFNSAITALNKFITSENCEF